MRNLFIPNPKCEHEFVWHSTVIGGFAACRKKGCWIMSEVEDKDCVNYVTSKMAVAIEVARKAKRKAERETKKLATIKYLQSKTHG